MDLDDFVKLLFKDKSPKEVNQMLVNLNKVQLNKKNHIKKYNKLRKIHAEILNSMEDYIFSGKYNIREFDDIVYEELGKFIDDIEIDFDLKNNDDISIFLELFVYKNHKNIPSVSEIYLKNKKFRNLEKKKLLECMNNSYISLFKVIDVDRINGYVTYQDVFTKKKFKIIDIALSSSWVVSKKTELYTYNRIITFEDISFGTGIHCHFSSNSKMLQEFIKCYNYKKCPDFIRCLFLYDIFKKDSDVEFSFNHNYS